MSFSEAACDPTVATRAVVHLLRSLREPRALRKNPLVRHVFASEPNAYAGLSRRIRSAVAEAAEELLRAPATGMCLIRAQRHHSILLRCDVSGEKPETVYRDLGLSRRQYFRERRLALESITHRLVAEFETRAAPTFQPPDRFELALAHAARLRGAGATGRSIDALRDLIAATEDPARLALLFTEEVIGLVFGGRIREARGVLARQQRIAASTADILLLVNGEQAAAALIVAEATCVPLTPEHPALHRLDEFSRRLRGSRQGERVVARALLAAASFHLDAEERSEARRRRREREELFENSESLTSELRADGMLIDARFKYEERDTVGAIGALERLLAYARERDLMRHTISAMAALAYSHHARAEHAIAREYALAARTVGKTSGLPLEYAEATMVFAEAEIALGHPLAALAALHEYLHTVGGASARGVTLVKISEIAALNASGAYAAAAGALRELLDSGPVLTPFLHAKAMLMHAQAQGALGDVAGASQTYRSLIDLLEMRRASPVLASAYAGYARLTGHGGYATRARSILRDLRP